MRWRIALSRTVLVLWLATVFPAASLPELRHGSAEKADCGCAATCSCRAVTGCCTCTTARAGHQLRHPCECALHHEGAAATSPDLVLAAPPRPATSAACARLVEARSPGRSWRLDHRLDRPPRG